jgi:hypothetical protein
MPERFVQMLESLELSRSLRGTTKESVGQTPRLEVLEALRNHPSYESLPKLKARLQCLNEPGFSMSELIEVARHIEKWAIQEQGFTPCQAQNAEVKKEDLANIRKKLWRDQRLRPSYPSVSCDSRALLISKALDEMNISSQQIYLKGPFIGIQHLRDGSIAQPYDYHIANTITVEDGEDLVTYVIDPAHSHQPTPIEDYLKNFSPRPMGYANFPQSEFVAHALRRDDLNKTCEYSNYALNMAEQVLRDESSTSKSHELKWRPQLTTESEARKRALVLQKQMGL